MPDIYVEHAPLILNSVPEKPYICLWKDEGFLCSCKKEILSPVHLCVAKLRSFVQGKALEMDFDSWVPFWTP